MNNDIVLPKWSRELLRFLPVKSQFLLWGNVYDVYPLQIEPGVTSTFRLCDFLREALKREGYSLIVRYEPLFGFSLLEGTPELFEKTTGKQIDSPEQCKATLPAAAKTNERLVETPLENKGKGRTAVILNFASRMKDICQSDSECFFYSMFRLAGNATPGMPRYSDGELRPEQVSSRFNPVIWVLEKENDLPAWFALDNQKLRVLPVPRPDHEIRRSIVHSVVHLLDGFAEMEAAERERNLSLFVSLTGGLFAEEIVSIVQLARQERLRFGEIEEAIRRYKLGVVENLWTKLDHARIADSESLLGAKVMGQKRAIRHAADILKRSVFNLSGAQFSRDSQRPKGVLFLAGPTGVGKTELAKAITELVFGSSANYIRFDMSEFGHEHADQRLVGAPPGYVGYDVGGELTNAVKQNPFSVVLFDEIEKAHPKILDIFLQILDDGRLTSGRGETVYFSECLIVFTSNLGVYERLPDGTKRQIVSPKMEYEEVSNKIAEAIDDFFKFRINRPEILNRIGKNIVVFDFIRQETAERIFGAMLDNILFRLKDVHGVDLSMDDAVLKELAEHVCKDLSMGGRGIGNNLEEILVNPLSRALFRMDVHQGESIVLTGVRKEEEGWHVEIAKNGAKE